MRIFTSIFSLLLASSAFAQINGDGFYRVKNVFTDRYLYVMDDKGSVDIQAMSADAGAIIPFSGFEKAVSNPATVIYFDDVEDNGKKFNFFAQGTSSYSIIEHNILIMAEKDGTYRCYATEKGTALYLADALWDDLEDEEGTLQTVKASYDNTDAKKWYVTPIKADGENYFGIKPTVTVGDKHYAAFFAAFAFNTVSDGMKVYKVASNNEELAVWEEVTGTVPAQTPVIIECSSTNPSDNRIDWIMNKDAALAGNILKGNFFRNGENQKNTYKHKNVTAYDANTMRVLGKTSDGSLGFVTTNDKYLGANSSYLPVTDAAAELKLVTQEEYDEIVPVDAVKANATDTNVYNAMGVMVRKGDASTAGLKKGLYIIAGKKVLVP